MNTRLRMAQWPWHGLGGIARNFLIMGGATALGQGAVLLVSPLLSRLYDPVEFGLLSLYTAVMSITVSMATLRFDLAIPIADDAREALHLLALSSVLAMIVSGALAIILLLWGGEAASLVGAQAMVPFLWLLPVAVLLASLAQSLVSWATYSRTFPVIGRMRVFQGIGQAVSQLLLGVLQAGPIGLMLGDVAGRGLGTAQLIRSSIGAIRDISLTKAGLRAAARARWGFARVMASASFITALSLQVPFLLIPALFDLQASGQYFLAYRMLVMPASLIVAAVGQVFFGEASHRRDDATRLHDLTRAASISLLVFSIPTYALVTAMGQSLIVTVFGQQWQLAGLYAQIMAPSLVFWTVANPMSSLPLIGGRERESLAFTVAELTLRLGSMAVGAALHSLTAGIAVLSIVSVAIELAAIWRFLRVAAVGLRELLHPAMRILGVSMPSLLLAFVARDAPPLVMLAVVGTSWLCAVGLAFRFSPEARALVAGMHG